MQWFHVLPSEYLKGTFPRVHKATKLEARGVSEKTTLGTQIPTSSLNCFYPDPRQKPSRPLSGACLGSSHSNMVMSGPQLAAIQALLGTDANRPQARLSWTVLARDAHLLMSQNLDTTLKLSSSALNLGWVLRRSLPVPVPSNLPSRAFSGQHYHCILQGVVSPCHSA